MPKDSENTHVNPSPHRDGRRDRVIEDEEGRTFGVVERKKEQIELKPDEDMREFSENMKKY
ncbi:hypothetical protein [Halobacillus salinus]|uniref:Uncharacterized protein n=1 Tax=Halobacillus salinus TaxID=192814 RepID=A0A4Z0GYI1_9BACI|nr:hypothetical protein [Halobacillus salinus]TGB02406.1 hypothetical protein E4663_13780 [Halobacillus salinus]